MSFLKACLCLLALAGVTLTMTLPGLLLRLIAQAMLWVAYHVHQDLVRLARR